MGWYEHLPCMSIAPTVKNTPKEECVRKRDSVFKQIYDYGWLYHGQKLQSSGAFLLLAVKRLMQIKRHTDTCQINELTFFLCHRSHHRLLAQSYRAVAPSFYHSYSPHRRCYPAKASDHCYSCLQTPLQLQDTRFPGCSSECCSTG